MDDHGGTLELEDAPDMDDWVGGALVRLTFPRVHQPAAALNDGNEAMNGI